MNTSGRKLIRQLSTLAFFLAVPLLNTYAQDLTCNELQPWGLPFSEAGYDVEIVGTTAYVAASSDGVLIYDVSNPRNPQRLGRYDYDGIYAQKIAVSGQYAFVANDDDGLLILDISNPRSPSTVTAFPTTEYAYNVSVNGDYAYVSTDDYALQIINISTPAVPSLTRTWMTEDDVQNVGFDGNYAYLSNENDGLQILDISNPAAPVLVGTAATDDYVYDVEVHGDYAYLADYGGGLQIFDISNPAAPVHLGGYETEGDAYEVDVIGNYAYVAIDYDGLAIIDISNPAAPTLVASPEGLDSARAIAVSDGFAYLCTGNKLEVVDVSIPTAPVPEDTYIPDSYLSHATAVGNLVYLACYSSGLQIYDASDPAAVVRLGGCILTGDVARVTIADNYAYVSCGYDGLYVVDVSDPAAPYPVAWFEERYAIHDIAVRPPYAFLADHGVRILDISDPANPEEIGYRSTSDGARRIDITGDTACLNDGSSIKLVDITNVRSPVVAGTYSNGEYGRSVQCTSNLLYAAYPSRGLEIIDISNPAAPVLLGGYDSNGSCEDIEVTGQLVYLSDSGSGLKVIDVSDPASPQLEASIDPDAYMREVTVVRGTAHMRNSDHFMSVIQVSSSNAPITVCAPDQLRLDCNEGASPAARSVDIQNGGSGTLTYSISADVPWITPQITAGSSTGEIDTITLNFDTSALSGGFHFGTVSVTDPAALNSPFTVPVELWIEPTPVMINSLVLPAGMEMVSYAETLLATNGTAPYSWAVVDGWPVGITNLADGSVSGKPILEGLYDVDVTVTDARGRRRTDTVALEIQSNPDRPPVVYSTEPETGTNHLAEATNLVVIVDASDPEGGPLSCSWTMDGTAVVNSSNQFNFITEWGDAGTYELSVLVSDGLWDTIQLDWIIEVTDDNDGDGIPNSFENDNPLLDPWNAADGDADPDGDHLDNEGEYLAGTQLDNADCDSDTLPDGWEVRYGFDPLEDSGGLPGVLCTQEGHWTSSGPFDGSVYSLLVQGNYIYAGVHEGRDIYGFRIFNVADPSNPTLVGSYTPSQNASYREIMMAGNYVYMAMDSLGFLIIDVSNPTAPSLVRTVNTSDPGPTPSPYGFYLDGSVLYVSDYYNGLKIYNASSLSNPSLLSPYLSGSSLGWDLEKRDDYIFLARGDYGLQVIDVSNPSAPAIAAELDYYHWSARSVAINLRDDYAFMAAGEAGMHVIDISTPTNPVWVAGCNTPGSAFDIHVSGDYAYIADYESSQMLVIDVSDPTAPILVGSYNAGSYAYSVQCVGDRVYVGTGNGLHVVNCVSEDTDADGLPDAWEMEQWTDLSHDGTADSDSDGISDLGEFRAELDPKEDDQDEDGILDGDEITLYNSDPRTADSDGDGISDGDELICGTSPGDPDDVLECSDLAPAEGSDGLNIVWQSVAGHSYRVEYTTDLVEGEWTAVVSSITATGSTCSVTDPSTASADGRFYRVVVLP